MELYKKRDVPFELTEINILEASDTDLKKISADLEIRLTLGEMQVIQNYFRGKGRNPYNIEVQSLGQAWSEHCCYKSSKPVLRKFLFGLNQPYVIDKGDAGVVEFDDKHAYAIRIESHNHPSAIEPYGGAATGIGGIIRDVLCMGAKPIALADPLFFGPMDTPIENVPAGIKHPKYLVSGVVAGIRDYGNRVGIPTVAGSVTFDESYVGNCLVNVACVGIAKKSQLVTNSAKHVGDYLVLVGGNTGRDGIHGANFASVEITSKTEEKDRSSVQLGDPITKEPVIHVCVECAEKGLLAGMKDLGAGGLSCVTGELCLQGGFGAEVHLDRVPLKEADMAPWEMWVSESQERMMMAVEEKNLQKVLDICKLWDVPATPIGRAIKDKVTRIYYKGVKIFEVDLDFLTKGPEYNRPCKLPQVPIAREAPKKAGRKFKSHSEALLALLSDHNICSKDWVIRQYDHEVQGRTIIKPLQGKMNKNGPGDATVLKPVEDSYRGLAISISSTPFITAIDPYQGGLGVIDEMCRNLAAVGAVPHSYTNCLNFGNPEKAERFGVFHEAVRGLGDASRAMSIPCPSGNVSLYNESHHSSIKPTMSVLGAGIVEDIRQCVTTDFKSEGNSIYILGKTREEFGGSSYSRLTGNEGNVPKVDLDILKKSVPAVVKAIRSGCIAACHDVSDGGLGVAVAEMCIGGDVGAEIDLGAMDEGRWECTQKGVWKYAPTRDEKKLPTEAKLFAESATRWVFEVKKGQEHEFETIMNGLKLYRIGKVCGDSLKMFEDGKAVIDENVEKLRDTWTNPFWKQMG
ncbi:MAG: phosphoribosylformylglycinamidine synthase subunit PurL [Candidatus Thermoplasmatota archaeon]|nr:phosphoribosylformylglycinamidine synthase subunit PurL [Candidatus Thermoplasmatota archaeon]